jgi:hypothetical protein
MIERLPMKNDWHDMKCKQYTVLEYENGDILWTQNGLWHRKGGPAVVYANGDREWWTHDKLHREDGPAIDKRVPKYSSSHGYSRYFLNGREYSDYAAHKEAVRDSKKPPTKTIEIEGKKYKLTEIKDAK